MHPRGGLGDHGGYRDSQVSFCVASKVRCFIVRSDQTIIYDWVLQSLHVLLVRILFF